MTVIAAQFCVPLVALVASEPPTRLGFQMYAGTGGVESLVVEDVDGEELEVDFSRILAVELRAEIDWTRRLPEALCENVPDAARVTVTRVRENSRTLEC